jgi:uncharacterized membrane protein
MIAAVDGFMLAFRFLHIVSGVLWVGSAFLFLVFIGPSAEEVEPSAQRLLNAAVKKRKASEVVTLLGIITVLAGWVMWLRNMSVFASLGAWVTSSFGLVMTIGGVLATIAAVSALIGVAPSLERLIDVGNEVAASGGPPSSDQQARIDKLRGALKRHGAADLVLLLLAVTAMATARYW